MVEPADGRDVRAVLLEWLENLRERVVLPGFLNLVVDRVHPIGEIDKDTPARARFATRRGEQRPHAIENRKGEGGTGDALENGTTIELRGVI